MHKLASNCTAVTHLITETPPTHHAQAHGDTVNGMKCTNSHAKVNDLCMANAAVQPGVGTFCDKWKTRLPHFLTDGI